MTKRYRVVELALTTQQAKRLSALWQEVSQDQDVDEAHPAALLAQVVPDRYLIRVHVVKFVPGKVIQAILSTMNEL